MTSQEYSDNPSSSTPSSSLEVEKGVATLRDGIIIRDPSFLRSRICHPRNLTVVFLLLLAFFLVGTDVFESAEMALPGDGGNDSTPLNNALDNNNKGDKREEDGSEWVTVDDDNDDDDSGGQQDTVENNNVVDLNAKNPNRDGVEFISPTCDYTCMTDRLPHESPLYPGQVLCNREHRFGMTNDGELFMQDCLLDTVEIIWSAKNAQLSPEQYPIHFEMQKNGYFQIISDPTGDVLLEDGPKRNVTYHYMCLHHKPKLDCPYLHLHPDGVLVLNWIDDHKWVARNVKQQYLGLFPDSK